MATFTHPYFGTLDTSALKDTDVIWETTQSFNGQPLDIWLWVDPGSQPDTHLLDSFATTLDRLSAQDDTARAALVKHLETESQFIDAHIDMAQADGAEHLDTVRALMTDAQAKGQDRIAPADFVRALHLTNVSLWCTSDDEPLVMDYRIDQEGSDQILAVKCDASGTVIDIHWES